MMDISTPYYEDMSRISNSNIGWFINNGPAYLYRMLHGLEQGATGPQLAKGTMIHEYLLQPDEFYKDYICYKGEKPKSDKQSKFADLIVNSLEIMPENAYLSAYKACYSVTGKSDEKILLEAKELASTLKDYIDFKKNNSDKIMISEYDEDMLASLKFNIENHKLANKLLRPVGTVDGVETHHEFHINWDFIKSYYYDDCNEDISIKCKSLLDSFTIDYNNKVVTLMDLKTTTHISKFETSVNQYDYTRQLAFYIRAIKWYMENELKLDPHIWSFKCYIIAMDSIKSHEVRVFEFNKEDLEKANKEINDAMYDLYWHIKTKKWDHRRVYYEGDGSEHLTLN